MSKDYERNLKRWRERRARMQAMKLRGLTLEQIAQYFDITRQRVGQILKER